MTGHYRVPKIRIPARVWFRNREDALMNFFAGAHAENHCGGERLRDLLEGENPFLAIENDRGEIEIVRKKSMSKVVVSAKFENGEDAWASGDPEGSVDGRSDLAVMLEDGERIDGSAHYRLPSAGRRLQDFLNETKSFLRLHRGDHVVFINMERVRCVRESGARDPELQ